MTIHSDVALAQSYASKATSSTSRGIGFLLSFVEFINLRREEFCAYTGVKFTKSGPTARTIERVNPKAPYIMSNCVAVTSEANTHKSHLDSYVHCEVIPLDMKIKLMRKALYQMEKEQKALIRDKETAEQIKELMAKFNK